MSDDWLAITDAVAYCLSRGLNRTSKTIRRWAKLASGDIRDGVASARQQDTGNGFRWLIARDWLDVKIEEELDFDRTHDAFGVDDAAGTGADRSEPVPTGGANPDGDAEPSDVSGHDRPGADMSGHHHAKDVMIEQLRERLDDRDEEVSFLRGELEHRRGTDKALADVIEAFRLNASNQSRRLQVQSTERREQSTAANDDDPGDEVQYPHEHRPRES